MKALGLDVGYSNLKLAVGPQGGQPRLISRPAGAAPADRLGERIVQRSAPQGPTDPVLVEVEGRLWAAAIEPGRFEGWQRSLHEDYAQTPAYFALVKAALDLAQEPHIDTLVTGLPVNQAQDPRRRDALRKKLIGKHDLPSGPVEVGDVRILAQPVGGYIDLLFEYPNDEGVYDCAENGTVLVLDAGYYSFDWALIVQAELRRSASGTSLEAMSVLLDRAAILAVQDTGGRPQPFALEAALRAGRTSIKQNGKDLALAPLLERATQDVATVAVEALRQALRRESTDVNLVVVVGGGGRLYSQSLPMLFPGARILSPPHPVIANARGFFRHAR